LRGISLIKKNPVSDENLEKPGRKPAVLWKIVNPEKKEGE